MYDEKVREYRIIKGTEHVYQPNELVVAVTLELTHAELVELDLALTNHVRHMSSKNYYYHDMKSIKTLLGTCIKDISNKLHKGL